MSKMPVTLHTAIVETLRGFNEIKNIGQIADALENAIKSAVIEIDPGGCAPPVYVPIDQGDMSDAALRTVISIIMQTPRDGTALLIHLEKDGNICQIDFKNGKLCAVGGLPLDDAAQLLFNAFGEKILTTMKEREKVQEYVVVSSTDKDGNGEYIEKPIPLSEWLSRSNILPEGYLGIRLPEGKWPGNAWDGFRSCAAGESDKEITIRNSKGEPTPKWSHADLERESVAFEEWWKSEAFEYSLEPYSLTCKNAMHAAWQEAALRAFLGRVL